MRAFVVEEAGKGAVYQVERPHPGPCEAIVAVRQAGVCGTDIEFFRGTQLNIAMGTATFPLRLGHEWSGVVDRVGPDVDPSWIGARVTGDTMSFRVGALVEPASMALRTVKSLNIVPGQRVLVGASAASAF
jgi:threonine dehydrogenase-like Zn-dependent dehydrogenase